MRQTLYPLTSNLRRFLSSGFGPRDLGLKSSYVGMGGSTQLLPWTMSQVLERAAKEFNEDVAVVVGEGALRKSFLEVHQDAQTLSCGLINLGLVKGDRLGIWGMNSYEWYITFLAAAQIGIIVVMHVNVNPAYTAKELGYCINLVDMKAIVCSEAFKDRNFYNILATLAPELHNAHLGQVESKAVPSLKHVVIMAEKKYRGASTFTDVFALGLNASRESLDNFTSNLNMDDPMNIQFTSGTTGSPKGACLSHHNMINNCHLTHIRTGLSQRPNSVCLCPPLYHCFGNSVGILGSMVHGFKLVMPSAHFDPKASLKAIQDEKLTYIFGTPTMFVELLRVQREHNFDLASVKSGIIAGAPCPKELCNSIIKELNMAEFVVGYGLTETSTMSFLGFPGDAEDLKVSTIGHIMEHTEAKVIDAKGHVVDIDTPGELCTRGYLNMLGYWNDEPKTREIVKADQWLHSGDVAILHSNGYAEIVGRLKDMVIRGGENIFPREIEEALHQHPLIDEAHVVGVPDQTMGEELCVWIKLTPNAHLSHQDMKNFLKDKLAHFKIPRYLHLTSSFPVTVTGKVQKTVMRQESIQLITHMSKS